MVPDAMIMPDEPSPAELYRRHGPTVFRRANQLLRNAADAHEVVQDVFLRLFQTPSEFGGHSSLTTFLYAVTTNACLNRLRNQRNRDKLMAQHHASLDDAEETINAEEMMALCTALARMPDDLAQVAVYYCIDGLTHDEIARLMSCSRRHVGDLLTRVNRWGKEQERLQC